MRDSASFHKFRVIFVFGFVLFGLHDLAWAAELSVAKSPAFFRPAFSFGFSSKYITDGFRIGGGGPVFQPWAGVSLGSTGLTVGGWGSIQTDRTRGDLDEFDGILQFNRVFGGEGTWKPQLDLAWIYWRYPNYQTELSGNKLTVGGRMLALPTPVDAVRFIPSYRYHHWFYWENSELGKYRGGGRHAFESAIALDLTRWMSPFGLSNQASLAWEASYHTGVFGIQPGWTHSVISIRNELSRGSMILTGSLNRQWAWQKSNANSVNLRDEWWSTLGVTFAVL